MTQTACILREENVVDFDSEETTEGILEECKRAAEKDREEIDVIIMNVSLQDSLASTLPATFDGAGSYGGNLGSED